MTFLNGILLGFVALGAIPIIIHLLNRSRFKVVQWAAMDFILRTLKQNSRRLQLRDLILLLLRTFAIILAALALARPTLAPGHLSFLGGSGTVTAVIVLDNSMSMATRDASASRFETAQRTTKDILQHLPRGSAATVVLMSDIATAMVAEPTNDFAYLEEAVARTQVSDGGTNLVNGMRSAWAILAKLPPNGRELYVVTDLQAYGWPKSADPAWRELIGNLAAASDLRCYVADTGATTQTNLSIERVEFTDDIIGTDGTSTVVASIRNHGTEPANQVSADLLIDDGRGGDLRSVANSIIPTLSGSTQVRLQAKFEHGGRHRLEVRIGPDHLAADNVRRLVVDVVDRVRVLVVDGAAEGGTRGGVAFLRASLSPAAMLAGAPGNEQRADRIETTVIPPSALAGITLDDYQAVILSDLAEPSAQLAEGLRLFVASGKGLIIFLGGNVRPDAYNRVFGERGLLPGVLGKASHQVGQTAGDPAQRGLAFATTELAHPIVGFFNDPSTQPFLAQPRIRQAWPLTMPAVVPGKPAVSTVVARLADGSPIIASTAVGRGQAVTFCLPADKEWSDLPLRPAFLMLMQRTVQHAALGNKPRLTISVHDDYTQSISARDANERFVARDPRGGEHATTPTAKPDGQTVLELTETPYAGFYAFKKSTANMCFAANPPPEESDLAQLDHTAVNERMGNVAVTWIGSGNTTADHIERARIGREIWPLLLILAICCLLAESVLALMWAPKGA
ncbi:MAG: VWA domain-containing protein [Planctomycetota bacterium]